TALPAGFRRAVHFLFEKLKTDDQARWLDACAEFLHAVRPKRRSGRRRTYSLKAWEYAKALQKSNPNLTAGGNKKALKNALPGERVPEKKARFRDWLRRIPKEKTRVTN